MTATCNNFVSMSPDACEDEWEEAETVVRALRLPSISPASDRTASGISRRTGISGGRVSEILERLGSPEVRMVRGVETPAGVLWMSTSF